MRSSIIVLATLGAMASGLRLKQSTCSFPAPSSNFTRLAYSGEWYEIAKFQTAGGAFFEQNCVCTQLNVTFGANPDDYFAGNICRDKTPEGDLINAVGSLLNENPAGRFKESFFEYAPSVDYTILFLGEMDGEEFSVEYDCGSSFFGTNYCVHFLSRKPTLSQKVLDYLVSEVNKLNLNYENLPLQMTKQEGCWNNAVM